MKKLKEIIKTGLIGMGNGALRAWGYEIKQLSYLIRELYLKLNSIKENNPMDYSPFLFIRYLIYYK